LQRSVVRPGAPGWLTSVQTTLDRDERSKEVWVQRSLCSAYGRGLVLEWLIASAHPVGRGPNNSVTTRLAWSAEGVIKRNNCC